MVAYDTNWKQGNFSESFCKVPLRGFLVLIRIRLGSKRSEAFSESKLQGFAT